MEIAQNTFDVSTTCLTTCSVICFHFVIYGRKCANLYLVSLYWSCDTAPGLTCAMEPTDQLLKEQGVEDTGKLNCPESAGLDAKMYSSGSEKTAYFDLLRLWVNQATMHQNACQSFPYYLMANSQQSFPPVAPLFNQSQQPLVNNSNNTATDRSQRDEGG